MFSALMITFHVKYNCTKSMHTFSIEPVSWSMISSYWYNNIHFGFTPQQHFDKTPQHSLLKEMFIQVGNNIYNFAFVVLFKQHFFFYRNNINKVDTTIII